MELGWSRLHISVLCFFFFFFTLSWASSPEQFGWLHVIVWPEGEPEYANLQLNGSHGNILATYCKAWNQDDHLPSSSSLHENPESKCT